MAKLPVYERQSPLMADVPQLQTPQYAAYARSQESLQRGLDVIGKYAAGEAEKQVIKQAQQYAVDNPITLEQLERSKSTGINPIESALNGGMVWNQAVQKLYAQQASTELTSSVYTHLENIKAQIDNGQLTDNFQIKQALEAPLKSYANVIAQIDPEEANAFLNRSITTGHQYYKYGLGKIREMELERQDDISLRLLNGKINAFRTMINNDDTSLTEAVGIWITERDNARQDFQNSSKKDTYQQRVDNQFNNEFFDYIAREMLKEYDSPEEAEKAFREGNLGNFKVVTDELLPDQIDALETVVIGRFNEVNKTNTTNVTLALKAITEETKALESGEQINFKRLDDLVSKVGGSEELAVKAKMSELNAYANIYNQYKHVPLPSVEAELSRLNKVDPNSLKAQLLGQFFENSQKAMKEDPVAYVAKLDQKELGNVDLLVQADAQTIINEFADQNTLLIRNRANITTADMPLSETQTNRVKQILSGQNVDDAAKIKVVENLVHAFPEHTAVIMNTIKEIDPTLAHLGVLQSNSPAQYKDVVNVIAQGRQQLINKTAKMPTVSNSAAEQSAVESIAAYAGANFENVKSAAQAYYIGSGGNLDTLDADLYLESFNAVLGARGDFGGMAVINDRYTLVDIDINRDKVADYIITADKEDLINSLITPRQDLMSIDGYEISMTDLRNASLMKVDEGYQVMVGANPIVLSDGGPMIIDLYTLRDIYNNKNIFGDPDAIIRDPGSTSKVQIKRIDTQSKPSRGTVKVGPRTRKN